MRNTKRIYKMQSLAHRNILFNTSIKTKHHQHFFNQHNSGNEKGQGVEQDFKEAKELYKKSCDLGGKISCDGFVNLNEAGY